MSSDYVNILGKESDNQATVAILGSISTANTSSGALDWSTDAHARRRLLAVIAIAAGTGTATLAVTESATSGGTYATATTSGSLTIAYSGATAALVSVKRNAAKPFVKAVLTSPDTETMSVVWLFV